MKILYLTNLIPCPDKPVGGMFNYKRIEGLEKDYSDVELKIIFPDSIVRKPFPYLHWKRDYDFSDIGLTDKKIHVRKYIEYFNYGLKYLAKQVIRFKEEFDYDIIHVHWTYPYAYVAKLVKALINVPYIVTCHGSDIHNLMLRDGHRRLILEGLKDADKVVFVSDSLCGFAKKQGYDRNNFQIITNGIDPEVFCLSDNSSFFENDYPVIGYISDFSKVKGGDLIPSIVNAIDNKLNGKVNFLFILKSKFGNYPVIGLDENRVKILRTVPYNEMGKLYAVMNLLLMPSRQEGWPCTSIEALACGVPVLGSDIPPIREVVPDEYGSFVDINQSDDIVADEYASKAAEMLSSDYDLKAMNLYSSKFSWKSVVKSEVELYRKILI